MLTGKTCMLTGKTCNRKNIGKKKNVKKENMYMYGGQMNACSFLHIWERFFSSFIAFPKSLFTNVSRCRIFQINYGRPQNCCVTKAVRYVTHRRQTSTLLGLFFMR